SIDDRGSEDAEGMEWLQSRSRRALLKNCTQVEADYGGAEVGRMQPYDLRAISSLWQQIVERTDKVRHPGAFLERILSRAEDVALQIHGTIAERQNRRHGNGIAIPDLNPFKRCFRLLNVTILRQAYAQHLLALVGLDALQLQVAELSCNWYASGEVQGLVERLLSVKFVNRRTPHSAGHCDLR